MSTPAANKRRRVDAANVTLRKPFHSPVIRRPQENRPSAATPEHAKPKPAIAEDAAAAAAAYSPSSPSSLAPPPRRRPSAAARYRPASPAKFFQTPVPRSGVKRKTTPAPPATDNDDNDDDDEEKHPGAAAGSILLALVSGHRRLDQDAVLKDLERRVEVVRQARRIEEASARARPGQRVDAELRELVGRWRAAGRTAAEEVFVVVRERVANSGGPKAWKEMRRRQMDFYRGWDEEDEAEKRKKKKRKSEEEEDGDGKLEEEFEGDDAGGGLAERQAAQERKEADEAAEDESEPEFNMAQMLQSLNIDLSLLGYDEAEEKWID